MWEDDYTNEFSIYTFELNDEAGRTTNFTIVSTFTDFPHFLCSLN